MTPIDAKLAPAEAQTDNIPADDVAGRQAFIEQGLAHLRASERPAYWHPTRHSCCAGWKPMTRRYGTGRRSRPGSKGCSSEGRPEGSSSGAFAGSAVTAL